MTTPLECCVHYKVTAIAQTLLLPVVAVEKPVSAELQTAMAAWSLALSRKRFVGLLTV